MFSVIKSAVACLIPAALVSCSWLSGYSQSSQNSHPWPAPAYTDTLKNPVQYSESAVKSGKKIYESICWTCHGMSGKGDGPASAALNPKPADHTNQKIQRETDGALFWKISNGRGKMQPYGKVYSAKQRWELVTYIRELGKSNGEIKTSSK